MTLIIDASVCVSLLIDGGNDGRWAEELVSDAQLVAPQLIFVESASVLRRLSLAGNLSKLEASLAHQDMLSLTIELAPYEPFADRIWSLKHNLSSYDAWYVALAESMAAPLATLDKRLINAAGTTCEFLAPPG